MERIYIHFLFLLWAGYILFMLLYNKGLGQKQLIAAGTSLAILMFLLVRKRPSGENNSPRLRGKGRTANKRKQKETEMYQISRDAFLMAEKEIGDHKIRPEERVRHNFEPGEDRRIEH